MPRGQAGPVVAELALRTDALNVRRAREFVVDTLRRWQAEAGLSVDLDDASLVVSELATNSVRYDGDEFVVRVCADEQSVWIEVHDRSAGVPVPMVVGNEAENGRGLAIVRSLSRRSGVTATSFGKTVWAVLLEAQSPLVDRSSLN